MAHETVTKSKRFYCVSLVPDICKTPIGPSMVPIPYMIIGEFKEAEAVSPNVKTHSEAVFLHGKSFIPTVKGDAAGTGGGVKSGTVGKRVESMGFSSTKGANGAQTVQESRFVWMNDRNTFGRIYERGVQGARPRITALAEATQAALHDAAQDYKDKVSGPLHQFGGDAMDAGGKVGMGSLAIAGAGAAVGATGIGLPAAAAMETVAAAGGTVSAVVSGTGAAADSTATAMDQVADYILTGKVPDVVGTLGDMAVSAAENLALKKVMGLLGPLRGWLSKKKAVPGQKPDPHAKKPVETKKPDDGSGDGKDGRDGGKTRKTRKDKGDKPSGCCPKNGAPGGKAVNAAHPVHFGTGEEILSQTDFVLDGPTPLAWTRSYRSGSETEDWGVLGARWAMPFTASLSLCERGIVYHGDSGRSLRLPRLAIGAQHDHRAEGFILQRDSDSQFTLTWRDGGTDTYQIGPDGYLPHGYDGVNAMLVPRPPALTKRYYLIRRAGRDGKGVSIERLHDAKRGAALLRVRTDDGLMVEALRDDLLMPTELSQNAVPAAPRVGRVDQVHTDGTRVCQVSYRYEVDATPTDAEVSAANTFEILPPRCHLVAQTNLAGQTRTYTYQHCLLVQYTTYSGFAHGLVWVSLASLRERWAGNLLDDAQLSARHPITQGNSYQARAVRTTTADGNGEVQIEYLDEDSTRVTEPDGGILDYRFDSNWLATEVRRITPDGKTILLGRREWDRDGMLLSDTDGGLNTTCFSYDAAGNMITVTDALRHVTRFDYNANNLPIAVTDALGHSTHSRYDADGRIVESTDELGRVTGYSYDAQGRLVTVTDARGGVKRLSYDSAGRLASYTDCSDFSSRYAYDGQNRLIESVDAIGNASHYQYDTLGRMALVIRPDKTTEMFKYDVEGNLVEHTDGKGQVTRYRYNGHGLPVERIDAKDQTLLYHHDKALRLVELVNGNGESYLFTYDLESRLASETGFDGKTTSYTYDSAGQLIASTCNGVRTDYIRDALGQLIAKSMLEGAVRYAYDALGRLSAVASPRAEQRFTYDAAGQLVDERAAYTLGQLPMPGQPRQHMAAFTLTHAYDLLGNRIQSTLPNGRTVDTQRYGSGHWHGTLWQGTPLVDLERDKLHRETTRQIGTGRERLNESRAYDPQSRLSTFTLNKGDEQLRERRYEYDAAGNLTHIDDERRGSTRYTYDPLGQLLSAVQQGWSETFAFDPAGNLLDPPSGKNGSTLEEAEQLRAQVAHFGEQAMYGNTPKLAKVTNNLLRQYVGHVYDYDAQGNTISKRSAGDGANGAQALALTYDTENRLVAAIRTGDKTRQMARYSYDAFGRRIAKEVSEERLAADGGAQLGSVRTTLFVWDGDTLVQEVQADKTVTYLYEPGSFVPLARIESGEGIASYAPVNTHLCHINAWDLPVRSNDPSEHVKAWQMQLEADKEKIHQNLWQQQQNLAGNGAAGDLIHYYQCDHLGTPIELLDEKGSVFWSARQRAWGKILRYYAIKIEQPLRFQGQYEDMETGLYYNRHRYYDPDSARYVTPDPIRLSGGINSYRYAKNPIGWIDPLGLMVENCRPCPCPAGTMDPKDIYFMQNNAKNTTGEYTVLGNAEALSNGKIDPNILKIKVWQDPTGKVWTLDHRRLAAFKLAKKCVPVEKVAVNRRDMRKMTTTNGGTSMELKLEDGTRITVE